MTAWAAGAWAAGAWTGTAWQASAPVTVPDVVGQTQAEATAALQAAGFVVAVVTAASSTVPIGAVISQAPTGGAEGTAGATVTITVSTGEVDLTDPKFQGPSHNTRIRWERKRKEEVAATEEPDLVEPPAPEPVAPTSKPRSTGLGEITPPPVKVRAPEIKIPEIKVVAPAKTAAAEPEPAPAPAVAPAVKAPAAEVKPAAPPASPAITPADLARIEREMTAFVEGVVAALTKRVTALDKALRASNEELAAARREIADLRRRETNRQRAEELARKIAEDDE